MMIMTIHPTLLQEFSAKQMQTGDGTPHMALGGSGASSLGAALGARRRFWDLGYFKGLEER
jgi:hypothetical protein